MTPREREVALLVKRDRTNYEIARELGIKVGTVKFYVHNLKKRGLTPRLHRSSSREREVALLVKRDLSNHEIAGELGIKVGTVKYYVHNLKKRGVIPRLRRSASGANTAAGIERIRAAQRRRWERWRAARSDESI